MQLTEREIEELIERLDEECWACKGTGQNSHAVGELCDYCDGDGRRLTTGWRVGRRAASLR